VGNQFGFRKGIATEDAILKLTNGILNALNNKTMASSIFCDLGKAFSSVNHDLLLPKLPYYGIRQNYYWNLIFRIDIIQFKSLTCILILAVSKWTKIKHRVLQFNFGPIVISSIHQWLTKGQRTQSYSYLIRWWHQYINYLLPYSVEKSPSWKANSFSASQIPHIVWNPEIHYHIHKCPLPVPILSQLGPVHTPTSHFLKIQLNIILRSMTGSPKWSLSIRFPHQNLVYTSPLPHMCYMPRPSHFSQF